MNRRGNQIKAHLFTILVLVEVDARKRLVGNIKDIAWFNLEHANLVSANDNHMSAQSVKLSHK
jgi:hypothetical protein